MSSEEAEQRAWRAGELAAAAGVSTDTLRHYERMGVLPRPPRSSNGYRSYPAAAFERVMMIRRAVAVGFTLGELAAILNEFDRGGAPCAKVRELAAEKLADVDEQLKALKVVRSQLKGMVGDWDARLAATPAGERATLLANLPDTGTAQKARPKKGRANVRLKQKKT
ncbi:MAG: heavy metal-responsive transcriptional regulator [Acidobacteriota bacterium]